MKDKKLHIDLIHKDDDKEWLFKIVRTIYRSDDPKNSFFELKTITKVLVKFLATEKCTYEGYQILHPVDRACDEPSEYKKEVELEEVDIVTFNDNGDYDFINKYDLESDAHNLIIDYITDCYEF